MTAAEKPLGRKNYGSIPHLPNSRLGPGDHKCAEGQARIATVKTRDKHDEVIVTEKLDGCLPYRSTINTDIGLVAIGKIVNQKLPVLVASYNEKTRLVEYKPITAYHKEKNVLGWWRIIAKSVKHGPPRKSITCTPNHRFFTSRGYIRADKLKPLDRVYQSGHVLSGEAKQVILGSLLGDSSILQPNPYNRRGFAFGHSVVQTEYFDFKMRLFGSLVYEVQGSRGGFEGSQKNRRACSHIIPNLHELISTYCVGETGKKYVTQEWADCLTPLALAVWYMDDGSIRSNESDQRHRARICTNGFSTLEVTRLQEMLLRKYGVEGGVFDYKGPIIVLTADGTERFFDLIYPYIPASMKYKLSSRYRERVCALDGVTLEPVHAILETEITKIEPGGIKVYETAGVQYDITVADNHNYFAGDLLVHNSNVGVARIGDNIYPLGRAGYLAVSSPYSQHRMFSDWAYKNHDRFMSVLSDGERIVGEWLIQAHGTRYSLPHEPFVAFDVMIGTERLEYREFVYRASLGHFTIPMLIHRGGALSIGDAISMLGTFGWHGADDPVEGAVWRVERNKPTGKRGEKLRVVDFLVKYVRPDKRDGCYLEKECKLAPVWNTYVSDWRHWQYQEKENA